MAYIVSGIRLMCFRMELGWLRGCARGCWAGLGWFRVGLGWFRVGAGLGLHYFMAGQAWLRVGSGLAQSGFRGVLQTPIEQP